MLHWNGPKPEEAAKTVYVTKTSGSDRFGCGTLIGENIVVTYTERLAISLVKAGKKRSE
jgi:hypothetical protein